MTEPEAPTPNHQKPSAKPLWVFPWGYAEGFVILTGLFLAGVAIEVATEGAGILLPAWPWNGLLGLIYLLILSILFILFHQTSLFKWLGGIPASITSIVSLTFSVFIMGLVPQNPGESGYWIHVAGFDHMMNAWPFVLSVLFLMSTLTISALKRLINPQKKKMAFFFNHIGLMMVLIAALLGTGDLERLTMKLVEGQTNWIAEDSDGNQKEMSIAFQLDDFIMEEYPPKLALFTTEDGKIVENIKGNLAEIENGKTYQIGGLKLEVIEWMSSAALDEAGHFHLSNIEGATQAAKIRIQSATKDTTGWISCGSFRFPPITVPVGDGQSVAMTNPEPKTFESIGQVFTRSGINQPIRILVNQPVTIEDWTVYQLSYDDRFGRWSPVSIIELVRDPWLPIVYIGIGMMLVGSLMLVWNGRIVSGEGGKHVG